MLNNMMHYQKVAVNKRLPELNKWVTTIDKSGNHIVFRLTKYGWNMRDASTDQSPNDNMLIVFWLEEIDLSKELHKSEKWDILDEKISKFYLNKDGEYDEKNPENDGDICSIGEIAAISFGYM